MPVIARTRLTALVVAAGLAALDSYLTLAAALALLP